MLMPIPHMSLLLGDRKEKNTAMIDIGWLAQHGLCKKYEKGEIVPCPGDAPEADRAMYILLAGRIDVVSVGSKPPPGISLYPGDVFGGSEYFTGVVEYNYYAAIDSVAYVITETTFSDLTWSQPDIVLDVLKAAYIPQGKPTPDDDNARSILSMISQVSNKAPADGSPGDMSANGSSQVTQGVKGSATLDEESIRTAQQVPAAKAPQAAQQVSATQAPQTTQQVSTTQAPQAVQQSPAQQTIIPKAVKPSENQIYPQGHKHYPGVTKPEYAKLVYKKDYTCPYCKKQFNDFRIFSSKLYESAPMRFDLRRFYKDFQSEWYEIITCRHCYFSTVYSYINESRPVLKPKIENELAAARALILLDFEAERDVDFVFSSHYLALICADGYLSYANPLRAKIWGNLSWLYEDVGDKEMEIFAAGKAATAYEEVYSSTRLTPVQEQTTCLSIAGMQRRAGIDKDLRKYLFQVKTSKMGEKAYIKLAEDIMDEMRVQ